MRGKNRIGKGGISSKNAEKMREEINSMSSDIQELKKVQEEIQWKALLYKKTLQRIIDLASKTSEIPSTEIFRVVIDTGDLELVEEASKGLSNRLTFLYQEIIKRSQNAKVEN